MQSPRPPACASSRRLPAPWPPRHPPARRPPPSQLWHALLAADHTPTADRWERFVLSWVRLLLVLTPETDGRGWTPQWRDLLICGERHPALPGQAGWSDTDTPPLGEPLLLPEHMRSG